MPKCDFNRVAKHTLRHGCSPVNLLHIFRTLFPKNTSGGLLLLSLHLYFLRLLPEAATRRPEACNFLKKETLAPVFSCEFCEISKNIFFTEHLRTTASVLLLMFP